MDIDQAACTIIANAGDSKADSFSAISEAAEGRFKEASAFLTSSTEKLLKAHEVHTQLLVQEANAEELAMKFILIHASNHLAVSEISREFAEVIVNLYKEVKKQ